ncbi:MAG: multidrug efflux SMR transporter [Bacteroidales bacterium]|nr:multidrug efflux SMR transporter [Bacteroidales bacterium]
MSWMVLIAAGLCEVAFSFCLGKTKTLSGMPYWEWMAAFAFFYVLSAVLLAKAVQNIPIGTAYPVWTGIGALGAVMLGIFVFHEPATFWRMFFMTTLIASIIGLKIVSSH